jgi:pimeloyl-ACP methyl ester carboxylesterase
MRTPEFAGSSVTRRAIAATLMVAIAATLMVASVAALMLASVAPASAAGSRTIRNIVLVHGAWVDGSGWKPVYEILIRDGYTVNLVQEPLTSFAADLAATQRVLTALSGPCVLVAHSYGGSLISEAGMDSHVVGLVYIAAHMPDTGESEALDSKQFPSALSKANVITKTPEGFTALETSEFSKYFAADLPPHQAEFEAHAQIQTAEAVFGGTITNAAWRIKPSWMLVPTEDLIISPDLERWYAKRAHATVVEIKGASHSVYESRPKEVAAMIEDAAEHAQELSARKDETAGSGR